MATRTYYYAESLDESTHTGDTDYVDKLSISFTCGAQQKYLILCSWLMKTDKTNSMPITVVYDVVQSSQVSLFEQRVLNSEQVDNYVSGFSSVVLTGEDVGDYTATYKLQYKIGLDTTATVAIKGARFCVLQLGDNDESVWSGISYESTTTTAWTDSTAVLTFTPSTSGEYIIFSTAELSTGSMSYDAKAKLLIDSTSYDEQNIEFAATSNYDVWSSVLKLTLDSSSHTIKPQFANENEGTATSYRCITVVALRVSDLNNVYYAETNTRATTTETTYQDMTTLTQTPQALDHLIIGVAGMDGSSTSYGTYVQLIEGASSLNEHLRTVTDTTSRHYPYLVAYIKELTAESTTWKVQYKTENASGTAGIQDSRIVVMQLESSSSEPTIDLSNSYSKTVKILDVTY